MKRVLVLLCLCISFVHGTDDAFQMFPSTFEQIADLSADEHDLVGGVVSPLSGQLTLRKTDLAAKGAQSISLDWVYIPSMLAPPPGNPSDNEETFDRHMAYFGELTRSYRGWVAFPQCFLKVEGSTALVTTASGAVLPFEVCKGFCSLQGAAHGMSNAAGEVCSGTFDPRNMKISIDGDTAILVGSDGGKKTYRRVNFVYFHLVHEVLPNGKVLRYSYTQDPMVLSKVESLDPKERYVYATLSFEGSPFTSCTASTGDSASYSREQKKLSANFKRKKLEASFSCVSPPLLRTASSPTYRDEQIEYTDQLALVSYSGKDLTFRCAYKTFGDRNLRVNALSFPDGTPYTFSYEPPVAGQKPGSATVHRADGVKIVYRYGKNLLLDTIEWFDPRGTLQKTKCFSWDENQRLKSVEWKDGKGKLFSRRTFECDLFGNPVVETVSGENASRTTRRKYTNNLLVWEQDPAGKITQIEYVDGTNLPKAKYILDGDQCLIREFWAYDDGLNLIEHTTEDTEVSQRTITRLVLRQQQPFLHMPEWKEELYWDGAREVLLKKTKFHYDKRGLIAQEDVHDANGAFAYTISREFDEQGNILSETNPLGHKTVSTYDSRGKQKTHLNFSGRLEKTFSYDACGRLKKATELTHTTTFDYDLFDRCIAKTDYLGHTTRFAYDPITSEISRTEGPSHSTTSTYDPFGRKTSSTDPNGNTTLYHYNLFGSPTQITYADNAQEHFHYTPIGSLASHTNLDGLTTRYNRDLFDRVTQKTYLFNDKPIAHETFTYSPFQLLSHRDKENHLTTFTYDNAGRKTSQTIADRTTSWQYDPLGRVCLTNQSNLLHIRHTHDFLGQLLQEQKTTPHGQILHQQTYAYDPDGNQTQTTTYPNNLPATTHHQFDPFGRLIRTTDPLGHITTISYDDTNHTQQTIDPNHIQTLITYDPYNRETSRQIGDQHTQTKTYDPAGNLTSIREGNSLTHYTYDSRNRLQTSARSNQRTTHHHYTPSGLLAAKTLPDQTSLHYEYSPLGHLQTLTSSDGTIHHTFTHTLNGHLTSAVNAQHTITRTIDPFGNILTETADGKPLFTKTYDPLNRTLTITLPDQSSIEYNYQSLLLRTITRFSNDHTPLYTHTYTDYDLAARPLIETLPHNLGTIEHTYDPLGRVTSLHSPHFTQTIHYEPNGRVASVSSDGTYNYDDLSQITNESLPSTSFTYNYDLHRNRIQKNNQTLVVNNLDEIQDKDTQYDLRGNLIRHGTNEYHYDALNQLISAKTNQGNISMTYDALGRRRSKTTAHAVETYCHNGTDELFSSNENSSLKDLKVPGLHGQPVALEIGWLVYVPAVDFRGNVRKLALNGWGWEREAANYSAFGERLSSSSKVISPWGYCGKRFDAELGLYYFGKRYYNPALGRWLTTDPLGDIDSTNLYQYALNNPLLYADLTGQSIGGYLLGLGEIILGGTIMVGGLALEICTVGGFTIGFMAAESAGAALIGHGLTLTSQHAQDISWGRGYPSTWKNNDSTQNGHTLGIGLEQENPAGKKAKKPHNTNPFEGPVDEEVCVGDSSGNIIPVPVDHQLGGTKDGKWIQVKDKKGIETGTRKDGGGHSPGPIHNDPRSWDPHAHVPGVMNPDGTPWLPIY